MIARNEMRRARTRRELLQLQQDAAAWLERRKEKDREEQFATQLAAVSAVIGEVTGALGTATAGLDAAIGAGEFAERCAAVELRILWLRRLWQFYRDRFDQRDDERLQPLLAAADEVVWSAYRPVAEQAEFRGISIVRGASPLPFVDAQYSPAATPRSWAPAELKRDGGALLALVEKLPIPLIHLPASSLADPWWLVFIGHEAGHHIEDDLGISAAFRTLLGDRVAASAREQKLGDPEVLGQRWQSWADEVFADACFVSMFGAATAGRALLEFELGEDDHMRALRRGYPPAVVRLALIGALGKALGMGDFASPFAVEDEDPLTPHFRVLAAAAAAAACAGGLPDDAQLGDLTLGAAAHLKDTWPAVPAPFDIKGPRRMAAAALRCWAHLVDEGAPPERLEALRSEVLTELGVRRLPGRRAALNHPDATQAAQDLARELLAADTGLLRVQVLA